MRKAFLFLGFAVLGLFLSYYFSDDRYEKVDPKALAENCYGRVELDGRLLRVFYSKKGNLIGVVSSNGYHFLVLLNGYNYSKGDLLTVKGFASKYSGSCWVFPKQVKLNDF